MIDIYDDLLEPHVAELIHAQMKGKDMYWHYYYDSSKGQVNKHWHRLCGHHMEECRVNGWDWLLPIWDTADAKYNFKEKYGITEFKRMYLNAHTHGIEPHMHTDDGDFTMIYYPQTDWKLEWGGGTMVDGQYVHNIGNRLIVFPAKLPHQAMPVSRQCYDLRTVVVFKTYVEQPNAERLDFYKD